MTFVKRIAGAAALGVAGYFCSLSTPAAQAAYTVTLSQMGTDVVASGSGTLDLAGLALRVSTTESAIIVPNLGNLVTGPTSLEPVDIYVGFTGPRDFGSNGTTLASSGSGDMVGLSGFGEALIVPERYASGNSLLDSSTYDNQTFASLGVTPGSYVWTWGSGLTADSFTLQIGPVSVPEPSSLALLALPLGFAALAAVRGRPFHVKRRAAT